jgi:hypothetical protein
MEKLRSEDLLETRVRAACGALVGILLGAFGGLLLLGPSSAVLFATIALAFAFAFLAVRFGDAFWLWLSRAVGRLTWFH